MIPLLLVLACSPDARESLEVPVRAHGLDSATFAVEGVEIRLDQATLVLTDLRLEEPEAASWSWSPIRAAHAHPGHDDTGGTVCELLDTWTLDLLGDPVDLGLARCLESELATGRLHLVGAPAAVLAGSATLPGGGTVDFDFQVDLEEEVAGISVSGTLDAASPPSAVLLGVSPAHMLSFADWTTADDGDSVLTLDDGLLHNTVLFGLVSTASFTLELP